MQQHSTQHRPRLQHSIHKYLLNVVLSTTILGMLHGCTLLTPTIEWPSYSYQERMERLTKLSQWKWRGSLLLSNATQHHHRVDVHWNHHDPIDDTLNFIAPLGMSSARITINQDGAQLQQSGQPTQHAASAEQLVQAYFGHGWPVQNITYWVRGMPVPNRPYTLTQNQHHHIQTLTQDDWQITYHAYHLVTDLALPAALTISNKQLTLKIKINSWQLPHQTQHKHQNQPPNDPKATTIKTK